MTTLRPVKIVLLLVCLVGFPIGGFWIGGRYFDSVSRVKDMWSQSRFAQLELALKIYHEEHGAFPPTKYQPVAGGPIHSWRILVLPHIDRDFSERYSRYDFSQEWSSPSNLQVLGRMSPRILRMGHDDGEITHYLAIGDDDEWPSKKPLRSRLITEGEDRFLLVEYPDSEIYWMEPKY